MEKDTKKLEQHLIGIKIRLDSLLTTAQAARALSAPGEPAPAPLEISEPINPKLLKLLETLMERLAELKEAVRKNTDVIESAITLLKGVSLKLLDVKYDPEAIHALASELNNNADALAQAIAAVPAAPVEIPNGTPNPSPPSLTNVTELHGPPANVEQLQTTDTPPSAPTESTEPEQPNS